MPNCYYCGVESSDLTQCEKCKQYYCSNHIYTESHDCPLYPIQNPYNLNAGNQSVQPGKFLSEPNDAEISYANNISSNEYIVPSNVQISHHEPSIEDNEEDMIYTDGSYIWHKTSKEMPEDGFDPDSGVVIKGILWPKKSELFHFFIAIIILAALASTGFINMYSQQNNIPMDEIITSVILLTIFYLAAFLVHELAHRQTAVHFNLQTKFRLFTTGVILSLIGLISPIKLALPGAVVVLGLENINNKTGWCKAAGPLSNLVLGSILLASAFLPFNLYPFNILFLQGAFFNFMLGSFNMLPFGILDGDNIRKWRPKFWLILFVVLLTLAGINLFLMYNKCIGLEFYYRGSPIDWRSLFPDC